MNTPRAMTVALDRPSAYGRSVYQEDGLIGLGTIRPGQPPQTLTSGCLHGIPYGQRGRGVTASSPYCSYKPGVVPVSRAAISVPARAWSEPDAERPGYSHC